MRTPTEAQILEAFERMYGKDLADTVRKLVGKNEINSVGRQPQAPRLPDQPPEEHWLDKLDK